MGIQLYNTLSRRQEPLETQEEGRVRMYVCGVTVYDYAHIGHARMMVVFDVVYRHLVHRGYDVTYVRNYTDVDDKIIARSLETGEPALELSARFCDALDQDLADLGLRTPDHLPKVSTHIPQIIGTIEKLVQNGHAYVADNGDVWYDVSSFPSYGKLSGRKVEDSRSGTRVELEGGKRQPADFALWKAEKPGEPSWDSPWGKGRPGWHIECSAMSMTYLGDSFDIHGGGMDLVFPHHENEIAQSEGATCCEPFSTYWMHNGMLNLDNEKMSKSLGNIVRIRDMLAEVPADVLRLYYLQVHYRSPLPYNDESLAEALASTNRLYTAKETAVAIAAGKRSQSAEELVRELGDLAADVWDRANSFADRFDKAMDDDFNTALALGQLFELARAVNRLANDKRARKRAAPLMDKVLEAYALVGEVLGIGGLEPQAFFDELKVKNLAARGHDIAGIEARLDERWTARKAKDWATADAIRAKLDALKVQVMDGADGYTWRVRVE